ncbi:MULTISPECIES: MIP/aquaporin family protein [unclassified Bacillus (in: firmicutes)]|uniref:MIP/aquaporin family protein n=1 Tax=unclassified Bacillus (in: firmicutes) TaxID=185979 RepID=UPI0008E5817C|nr:MULTISPECIES: MIP/aquaporin family protein [unclassified Bacillus (in: firmicutes)]SFI08686.1 glycerol uptake facilitator protein [Bacillus sp. 71mf]SFS77459.1 glycerol uptake facilitator protein [Bacillus sp. 103mf]
MTAYIAEIFATALLIILGNGVVANVHLKGAKGHKTGWMVIATGWGFAVGIPAVIFGGISGNHINPAFTIGLALNGKFPWEKVVPYIIAQLIGAFIGAVIVWLMYKPFMDDTEDTIEVLGCFGSVPSYKKTYFNAFITEFIGTFILIFSALGIVHSPLMGKEHLTAHVVIGFLVWGLVLSVGGPTGPALNPARDIMPRLAHTILPIKGKGSSHWHYAWVPVIAPIAASIIAVYTYFHLFK